MKKGFTLIELLVTIGVISILLGITFPSVNGFNKLKAKIEMDYAVNSVVDFINGCKGYSRNNNESIIIRKNTDGTELGLYLNRKRIRVVILPQGITVDSINSSDGSIDINNLGVIQDVCTIKLKNKMNVERNITIKLGTKYVSEKT
jgi:prepilin-type N-terminal cleavage/methylation domain-containing protein